MPLVICRSNFGAAGRRRRPRLSRLLLALVAAVLSALPVYAAVEVEALKAAVVLRLPQYVSWPGDRPPNVLRIGILGPDPLGPAIDTLAESEPGRNIEIKRSAVAAALTDCHVVYVSPEALEPTPRVVQAFKEAAVLTLGEGDQFLEQGGMVRLTMGEDRRIRLHVHLRHVREARLSIRAQLLRLCTVTGNDPS